MGTSVNTFGACSAKAQAREEEACLEALLVEGLASKRLPLDAEFLKGIEAKTAELVDKYKDRKRS